MSSFDGDHLFDNGPHTFHIGGLMLRYTPIETAGSVGTRISHRGLKGRQITQTGTLVADSIDALDQQVAAIEAKIDGLAHTLVDEHERTHENVVMLAFEPHTTTPVGTRWQRQYEIEYLQVKP